MSQFPPEHRRTERERIDHLRHGVNNPLAIIRGQAQLLQLRLKHPEALDARAVASMLKQLAAIDIAVTRAAAAIEEFDQVDEPSEDDGT